MDGGEHEERLEHRLSALRTTGFDSLAHGRYGALLMTHLRRLLAPVTAIWLLSQLGTVALVPFAVWMTSAEPHSEECTCGHGPGAMCPMHHKPASSAAPCAMQAADQSGNVVLTALASVARLVSEPPVVIAPVEVTSNVRNADVRVVGRRSIPPDPPPPRA